MKETVDDIMHAIEGKRIVHAVCDQEDITLVIEGFGTLDIVSSEQLFVQRRKEGC